MIGIYSAEAAERFGSNIYLRPDGTEAEVTCVCESADFDYRWPDKVIVGEVTKWVRQEQRGAKR